MSCYKIVKCVHKFFAAVLLYIVLFNVTVSAAVIVFLTCLSTQTYFTTTCYVGTRESYLRHLKMLYFSL
jgi:hypothetical protein